MSDWDTRGLHREACDAFTTASTHAQRGKELLDEIAAIGECLRKMETLDEVRIVSCNDSTWQPPIASALVKQFVRQSLEKRRDELRAQFNRMTG